MDCKIPVKATRTTQFHRIFPVDGLRNSSSFYRNFAVHLPENQVKLNLFKRLCVGFEFRFTAWVANTLTIRPNYIYTLLWKMHDLQYLVCTSANGLRNSSKSYRNFAVHLLELCRIRCVHLNYCKYAAIFQYTKKTTGNGQSICR